MELTCLRTAPKMYTAMHGISAKRSIPNIRMFVRWYTNSNIGLQFEYTLEQSLRSKFTIKARDNGAARTQGVARGDAWIGDERGAQGGTRSKHSTADLTSAFACSWLYRIEYSIVCLSGGCSIRWYMYLEYFFNPTWNSAGHWACLCSTWGESTGQAKYKLKNQSTV